MDEDKLLDVDEAAEFLGVHSGTLRLWLRKGVIKGRKFGRVWRISKKDLLQEKQPE
jgi:excisionase family DNA binding protein